jgi:hypothetical protein
MPAILKRSTTSIWKMRCSNIHGEFRGDKVARETQYFGDPFEASAWRAQWAERMGT